jgi:hypothetical protein
VHASQIGWSAKRTEVLKTLIFRDMNWGSLASSGPRVLRSGSPHGSCAQCYAPRCNLGKSSVPPAALFLREAWAGKCLHVLPQF